VTRCPSEGMPLRPSDCPIDQQQQRRASGLLHRSGSCSIYRSIAASAGTQRRMRAASCREPRAEARDTYSLLLCFRCEFRRTCICRYGRNDTRGAARCRVPFTRNCDFDVQHSLSEACGGRQRCSVPVNTKLFGDPCGYDEFLTVVYRCVHGMYYGLGVSWIAGDRDKWFCTVRRFA